MFYFTFENEVIIFNGGNIFLIEKSSKIVATTSSTIQSTEGENTATYKVDKGIILFSEFCNK
jgi:hypothetical protein